MKKNRKVETIAAQAGVGADKAFGAVSVPIYLSAIYRYERFGKNKGFDYSRGENPTRQAVEKALADLEGGSRAVAFSSGMAAISALMTLFRTGDHILCSDDLYGGTYRLFEKLLRPYGLSFDYVDMGNPAAVRKKIRGKTKALFIETPTNPLMKIADLKGAARIGREKGVLTVVDNTFMSPLLQRPLGLGIDVVVHSATKFLGGHNDLIGGAVVTTDAAVGEKIAFAQKAIGAIPSPFDCWLLLRGIKTLAVRVTRAQENAEALARFLSGHPAVGKIYYPGLPDHPRRELHFSQASGAGSIISFDLKREKAVPAFLSALKTILLAESLGGVESLITHPSTMTHADIPLEEQAAVGLTPSLVRLSVGIEDRGNCRPTSPAPCEKRRFLRLGGVSPPHHLLCTPVRWLAGPWPLPIGGPLRIASVMYSLARLMASGGASPLASPAAMAEANVQPVPWVFLDSIRGEVRRNSSSPPQTTSTALDSISRLPPLMTTHRHPNFFSSRAAFRMASRSSILRSRSASASKTLGVMTVASGSSSSRIDWRASSASRESPLLATITGSTTRLGMRKARIASATVRTISALDSMPVLAASAPMSVMTLSICFRTNSGETSKIPCTPTVFWAVRAVMADMP